MFESYHVTRRHSKPTRTLSAVLLLLFPLQACYSSRPAVNIASIPIPLPARMGQPSPTTLGCPPFEMDPPGAAAVSQAADLNERARGLAASGSVAQARQMWLQAASVDPTNQTVAFNLAQAYETLGEPESAAREFCHYLAIDPNVSDATQVRARAASLLTKPLDVPEAAASNFRVGIAYAQASNFEGARDSYDQAINVAGRWADAYLNRGLVREALQDFDGARGDFDRFLTLDPTAPDRRLVQDKIAAMGLQQSAGRQFSWGKTFLLLTVLGVAGFVYVQCTAHQDFPCSP